MAKLYFKIITMKKNIAFLYIVILFFACNTATDYKTITHNPNLYANTVHALNEVVMGNNFSPIIASRNYAYAAIAGYEVTAAGNSAQYQSLAGQLKGFTGIPAPKDTLHIDFPFAAILAYCMVGEAVTFPKGSLQTYTDSLKKLVLAHGMTTDMLKATDSFAKQASVAVIAWSKKDNYPQTRTAEKYTVKNIPGRWIPTPPMYAPAAEPHWAEIRTMILDSASQFRPIAPPTFNVIDKKSEYYMNVMMVKNAGDSLTEEQKHIANFWDDNPFKINVAGHVMTSTKKFSPPGHWMSIVGIANKTANANFETISYAYAITAISLFDSFIHCWDAKYTFNTVRPETVINKYIDANWRPLLQTPAFPEYTCGHSTISSAAAEALTSVYGDHFSYTDSTELEFGIANRKFTSFRQAADENNWARFYGGLHFHNSCITSTQQGKLVGNWVVNHLKMKK